MEATVGFCPGGPRQQLTVQLLPGIPGDALCTRGWTGVAGQAADLDCGHIGIMYAQERLCSLHCADHLDKEHHFIWESDPS